MIVHFIGAGPGAPDLITVRGLKLVRECPVVLFAGSLIPKDILAECRDDAKIVDTADLTLDQIVAEFVDAHAEGMDVARLHSGDPSIYGAVAEQMRHLDRLGINYDVVPGVPAFAAAAAMLKRELTLPGISQSVILTRTSTNSSPMPVGEDLATLGRSGATLALHLSAANLDKAAKCLIPHYGADCPAILA
jgi:precorrin-4/cobalt-precorrin-4 C11-methyltransferase